MRTFSHMGLCRRIGHPEMDDREVGHRVRMLLRSDLRHEDVVETARDRILHLSERNDYLVWLLRNMLLGHDVNGDAHELLEEINEERGDAL